MINYYELFGIPADATPGRIKSAYKRLALQYHPDRNPHNPLAEESFKVINEGYQILSNSERKQHYDLLLLRKLTQDEALASDETDDQSTETSGPIYAHPKEWDIEEHYPLHQRIRDNRLGVLVTLTIFACLFIFVFLVDAQQEAAAKALRIAQARERERVFGEVYQLLAQQEFVKAYYEVQRGIIPPLRERLSSENAHLWFEANSIIQELDMNIREITISTFKAQNYLKAIEQLEFCLAVGRIDSTRGYEMLIDASIQTGDHAQAERFLSSFEKLAVDKVALWHKRAKVAGMLPDNVDQVIKYYEKGSDAEIEYLRLRFGGGYLFFTTPDHIPHSHYALSLDFCRYLYEHSKPDQALSITNWLLRIRPNRPETYLIKGDILFDKNQRSEACKMWLEAKYHESQEADSRLRDKCS